MKIIHKKYKKAKLVIFSVVGFNYITILLLASKNAHIAFNVFMMVPVAKESVLRLSSSWGGCGVAGDMRTMRRD
jgi:hypothetical protein